MTRRSRDRIIMLLLVCALGIQAFLLLAHTGVIRFGRPSSTSGIQAGQIKQAQNHLRRRSLNSLVWEVAQVKEPVFLHDSVLTLKGSTATLELDSATEVKLSENTLITIEPPNERRAGEIRLRFVRGNLSARNPYAESTVTGQTPAGESWDVALTQGSEIEMRDLGTAGVEFQLKGGQGVFHSAGGETAMNTEQILRLNPNGLEPLSLSASLAWTTPPPKRLYLHGDTAPVQLEFKGLPDTLVLQTLGHPETALALSAGSSTFLADLPLGNHRLYLRKGQETSAGLDIQVWRAPSIHLLSPLPRNRVDVGAPTHFVWQRAPNIEKFKISIQGATTSISRESTDNSFDAAFSRDEDVQWSVEGVDSDGIAVPPLYRYPLYIREKPFEAPKLRQPRLREPAKAPPGPGAWLWSWVLPTAHAEGKTRYEAVFSWEAVPGADQYVIEISESADFRDPVVNKVVRGTEYAWGNLKIQSYYWRVAAGNSRGRMGKFSEPVLIDLTPLQNGGLISVALDGVVIRKILDTAAEAVARAHAPTPPPTEPPPSQPEVPPPVSFTNSQPGAAKTAVVPAALVERESRIHLSDAQKTWRLIALWQPRYGTTASFGTQHARAVMSGASPTSFGFEVPWRTMDGTIWLLDGTLTHYTFQPDPKEKFPFQKTLNWMDAGLDLLRFTSKVGYGLSARQTLSVRRVDNEAIAADTVLGFGGSLQWNIGGERNDFNARVSLLANRDGQILELAPEWRTRIGPRFVTGAGLTAQALFQSPNVGYSVQGFVTVGFPF